MALVVPLAAEVSDWARFGLILGGGLVIAFALDWAIGTFGARGDSDPRGARVLGRLVRVVVIAAAVIYALPQVGVRIGPLLTAAGIGGVALAFAVRTIFENFLAGILILLRRPFRTGDQIASGDHEGTVEDVNLRATVLRTFDGTRVFIPNGKVLSEPIVNRTAFPLRRTELAVGVDYEADLDRAAGVIERAVSAVEGVRDDPAPEALVYEIGESSINLCVRFWHASPVHDEWLTRHRAAIALKRALDEADIGIPFPQVALRQPGDGAWAAVRVRSVDTDAPGTTG